MPKWLGWRRITMIKKIVSILMLMILFYAVPSINASARDGSIINTSVYFDSIGHWNTFNSYQPFSITTKKGEPYDETKDPALRKGTENWEEKQGSFFVVPALLIGVVLLIYLLGRLK
jgi:hypothetical protein